MEIAEPADDLVPLEIAIEDLRAARDGRGLYERRPRDHRALRRTRGRSAPLSRPYPADGARGLLGRLDARARRRDARKVLPLQEGLPLVGGMARPTPGYTPTRSARTSRKLGAEHLPLAAPAIAPVVVQPGRTVALPGIGDTLAEGAACDVAVVGLGGYYPHRRWSRRGTSRWRSFSGSGSARHRGRRLLPLPGR